MTIKANTSTTVKAAVIYAQVLATKAEQEIARDPWASPYRPTEASARKLCNRFAQEATSDLPITATETERETARATGPSKAIAYMTMRAKMHTATTREQDEISTRSEQRHRRRQDTFRKHRDADRANLSPGNRIDGAIARLRLVASAAAARLETQTGENADKDMTPPWTVDAASKAVQIAQRAVREIEQLEDDMRVRNLGSVAA